ncbi:MAG TPA: DEAD/DEAH box helicase [Patescibacteria group bacterium]|nr:DEAD/DEAH box helicase [Patescibacteria group bacterium]
MDNTTTVSDANFKALGIHPRLVSILDSFRLMNPTPIQALAIPVVLTGVDVIGIAQTGTGKTLAFGLPMLQTLVQTKQQGLVLLPTRELALQVDEQLKKIGASFGLKTAILIGGVSAGNQLRQLKARPNIIIATPGRLNDFLEQKQVDLSKTGILVLDEADRMLDMGFLPQINRILAKLPATRQTLLFSATMPDEMKHLCAKYMKHPKTIAAAKSGTTAHKINQGVYFVATDQKFPLVYTLINEEPGSVLVFTRTKHGAKRLTRNLNAVKIPAVEIHGNRTQAQRQAALSGFKTGKHQVLVATDIAARGIDVSGIALVINYDLPQAAEDYVHRIGRTARAGREGRAVSFAGANERSEVRAIERVIKKAVPVLQIPPLSQLPEMKTEPRREFGSRERSRRPSKNTRPSFAPRTQRHSSRPTKSKDPIDAFLANADSKPRYKKFFYAK